VSLEVYEDGSFLRYSTNARKPRPRNLRTWKNDSEWLAKHGTPEQIEEALAITAHYQPPSIEVTDDLGTQYSVRPAGSSGNDRIQHGLISLTPAIPDTAAYLRIAVIDQIWKWQDGHIQSWRSDDQVLTVLVDL
jgi:hypothetical protein